MLLVLYLLIFQRYHSGHSVEDCFERLIPEDDIKAYATCMICNMTGHTFCTSIPNYIGKLRSSVVTCYNCGSLHHSANDCKLAKAEELLRE